MPNKPPVKPPVFVAKADGHIFGTWYAGGQPVPVTAAQAATIAHKVIEAADPAPGQEPAKEPVKKPARGTK